MECFQNYFVICLPLSVISIAMTHGRQKQNVVCFLQINFQRPTIYNIYWTPYMEFYLIKNQSYLLHRVIKKTYSSIITALFCVRFDVVITDIKTKCSPDLDLHVNIYIHIDMHVLYVSICICMCVIFIYFIHLIIYVRDKHKTLHCIMENSIVPKCCTVTCSFAPCFENSLS